MTFTDAGRLFALGSTYYQDISVDWTPSISADRAKEIARIALPFQRRDRLRRGRRRSSSSFPCPLSETQVEHHLVWEARVHTADPLGGLDHRRRRAQRPDPPADQRRRASSLPGERRRPGGAPLLLRRHPPGGYPYVHVAIFGVGDTYADGNGNWIIPVRRLRLQHLYSRLYSPYVDVQNMQGSYAGVFATVFPGVPYQVVFNDTNSRADERDVFIDRPGHPQLLRDLRARLRLHEPDGHGAGQHQQHLQRLLPGQRHPLLPGRRRLRQHRPDDGRRRARVRPRRPGGDPRRPGQTRAWAKATATSPAS